MNTQDNHCKLCGGPESLRQPGQCLDCGNPLEDNQEPEVNVYRGDYHKFPPDNNIPEMTEPPGKAIRIVEVDSLITRIESLIKEVPLEGSQAFSLGHNTALDSVLKIIKEGN